MVPPGAASSTACAVHDGALLAASRQGDLLLVHPRAIAATGGPPVPPVGIPEPHIVTVGFLLYAAIELTCTPPQLWLSWS